LLRFDVLKSELECINQNGEHHHLSFSNILYRNNSSTNDESQRNNLNLKRSKSRIASKRMKHHQVLKLNDLKLGFSEFYLMLILLKNYQTLNSNGFCKILKKHDKLFETTRGYQWK
jgi:hypothetical protein